MIKKVRHPNRRTVMIQLDAPGRTRQLSGQHYVVRLTGDDGYPEKRSHKRAQQFSHQIRAGPGQMLVQELLRVDTGCSGHVVLFSESVPQITRSIPRWPRYPSWACSAATSSYTTTADSPVAQWSRTRHSRLGTLERAFRRRRPPSSAIRVREVPASGSSALRLHPKERTSAPEWLHLAIISAGSPVSCDPVPMSLHSNDLESAKTGGSESSGARKRLAGPGSRGGPALQLATAVLGLALLASGCASPGSAAAGAAASNAAQSVPSEAAVSRAAVSNAVPSEAAKPLDPIAPSTYLPVARNGSKAKPLVKGIKGGFSKAAPVKYADGVSLSILRITARVEKGKGPGVFPGRPYTAISLSLANGSSKVIDLNQVVVTTTYGSPARLAAPVYEDSEAKDFAGTVKPGASATATYMFAIPTNQKASVTTMVDFDNQHFAAGFTGAAG